MAESRRGSLAESRRSSLAGSRRASFEAEPPTEREALPLNVGVVPSVGGAISPEPPGEAQQAFRRLGGVPPLARSHTAPPTAPLVRQLPPVVEAEPSAGHADSASPQVLLPRTVSDIREGDVRMWAAETGFVSGETGFVSGETEFVSGETGFVSGETGFVSGGTGFVTEAVADGRVDPITSIVKRKAFEAEGTLVLF